MKNRTNIIVRKAGSEDTGLIRGFIVELAAYEKLLAETRPDADALRRDLRTGANPRLHCLIAEIDSEAAGMAAYFLSYSTNRTSWKIHLQDILIREPYRNHGVGEALLRELGRIARANGYIAIEFEVLRWNAGARKFYERFGAITDPVDVMSIEGEALLKLCDA